MNIKFKMTEIDDLRIEACQEYFKQVLKNGWQQQLYSIAEKEVKNNGRFKDKYIETYNSMRDRGISCFSVEDMDITIMSQLPWNKMVVNDGLRKVMAAITKDKNETQSHRNGNETNNELYRRAHLYLENLRDFVRAVDKDESIDDIERAAYRQKYISRIDSLDNEIDDERIKTIQKEKEMADGIARVLSSADPGTEWMKVLKPYMDNLRDARGPEKYDEFFQFVVQASDAGIPYAHWYVVEFCLDREDYAEATKRIELCYPEFKGISKTRLHRIVKTISNSIHVHKLSNEVWNSEEAANVLMEKLRAHGYDIVKGENGQFDLSTQVTFTEKK